MASPATRCANYKKQYSMNVGAIHASWVLSLLAILCMHLVSAENITIDWRPDPVLATTFLEKRFKEGDILHFRYTKGFHNVIEVNETDYKACKNTNSSAPVLDSGDDVITLTAGEHQYICGITDHCANGQKVVINVDTLTAPASAPAPGISNLKSGSSITIISATALVIGAVLAVASFILV